MAKTKKTDAVQPEINIGLVGHVDHGKTTLTEKLSGKWTDTHSEEIKRGITIRLGYADSVFRKCKKCRGSSAYTVHEKCKKCEGETKVIRKVSFVDAPGHESLMATMLAGATIIDGALLLISADERCPQPQTREHLMALEISGITNVIIVQNKIDAVPEEQALKNYEQIKEFLKNTPYKDAPIIPISARLGVNIDLLIETIEKFIPTPKRDPKADPVMLVARSFDINKPGITPDKLIGGVLGGSLKQGIFKVGQEIEIKPGYKVIEKNQAIWKPLKTKITDLKTGGLSTKEVGPGGSIGILTSLDPSIVKSDQLTGSLVGIPGKLPKVWYKLSLEIHLLERVVGAKQDIEVESIKMSEALMLNTNSAATVGIITNLQKNTVDCTLKLPVCAEPGSRVTISRRLGNRFRLIGYGIIKEK
ncbi:MAG: translation initiation factor IF-2 subunit gamma [Nanoarchaeota archaeon]|nr:translation initiation factor IF-2 subunit gamma [Nanoarchaeota archaeon]